MPKQIWFKAKHYGYGWYPATWQGWVVIGIFLALDLLLALGLAPLLDRNTRWLWLFFSGLIVINGTLIYICAKTGEPAKWRWGK